MKESDIIITMEGGLVQGVCVAGESLRAMLGSATVIDYDTEGADENETVQVDQGDGTSAEAVVHVVEIGKPVISVVEHKGA